MEIPKPDDFPGAHVSLVSEMSEALFLACQRLVPQLTQNNPPPTREELGLLLASPGSFLFQAQHAEFGAEIIGLATLVIYRVPTGLRGYIEDVIVDERARGRGIGAALSQACLDQAQAQGVPQVMLTSNPNRTAANRLYERMGFELRRTNVYRIKLSVEG